MADTDSLERIRKALEDLESPPSEENDLARAMARLADERRFAAACNPVDIRSLLAREAALREALRRISLIEINRDANDADEMIERGISAVGQARAALTR